MQNGFTKVVGHDKNGNDIATLEQRLERTGHLWVIEDTVNFWAKQSVIDHGSVNFRDRSFIANEVDYKLFKWEDITHYSKVEIHRLVGAILIRNGYAAVAQG